MTWGSERTRTREVEKKKEVGMGGGNKIKGDVLRIRIQRRAGEWKAGPFYKGARRAGASLRKPQGPGDDSGAGTLSGK